MRLASIHETDAIVAFYRKLICDNMHSPYHPDWRVDIYPTNDMIASYIARGELYVLDADSTENDRYIAAFVLSDDPVEGYDSVSWQVDAPWEDIVVVHLLCVGCAYQHRGIGRKIVQALLSICRTMKKRAVRLDVMTKNLPAQKLYSAAGFTSIGKWCITYEDTGPMEFLMYEFDLEKEGINHND